MEHDFTAFLKLDAKSIEPVGLYDSIGLSQPNLKSRWIKNSDGSILVTEFWKIGELEAALPRSRSKTDASGAHGILTRSPGQPEEMSAREVALVQNIYQESFETIEYSSDPMTAKGT